MYRQQIFKKQTQTEYTVLGGEEEVGVDLREVGRKGGGGGLNMTKMYCMKFLKQLVKMYFKIRLLSMRRSEGCLDFPVSHWVARG